MFDSLNRNLSVLWPVYLFYGMFVACGIWCLADVSGVSPSSEQTKG